MSSFFIRQGKGQPNPRMKRKGKIYHNKTNKIAKKSKNSVEVQSDEEISSDEDEIIRRKDDIIESDEEAQMTTQEKKVKLAKEYLKDIEKEEREKLEVDELDNDVILGRLHEEVLNKAGKLRRKVADDIIKEYKTEDYIVLKCKEHKLAITCITISTDNILFSGSKDCSIVKWSLSEMTKVGCIPPKHKHKNNDKLHASAITCLAVSHDNKYLASSDDSSSAIQIWDPKSLTHVFTFQGHRASVSGLAFCRFTKHLYSCSKDRTVKVWSIEDKAYLETLFGHHMPITGLDVLSKNKAVTSGGTDNSVRVWKIQEESQLIYNHTRSVDGIKRLDDHHFISFGDDGAICIWAITKKKPLHIINNAHGLDPNCKEPRWITSVACISNSDVFASGSSDGLVKLWKCDDNFRGAALLAEIPINGFINSMAFTADSRKLALGVGQEHRLGRWSRIKEAKNSIVILNVQHLPEEQV